MAATFFPTGAYSNLSRLELEQLRRADFFTGGKALTVGDSDLSPEGVVGKGDVNAEPYTTNPSELLDDVYSLTPPTLPGPGLGTQTEVAGIPSETVAWYGPGYIQDGTTGAATASTVWTDVSASPVFTDLVAVGDILLIKPKLSPTDFNANCAATVAATTTISVTAFTNNAGLIEVQTSGPHGLITGQTASIAGATGTNINAVYTVTVIDGTHFTLDGSMYAPGPYSGGNVLSVGPLALNLINIHNPSNATSSVSLSTLSTGADQFEYLIVRPTAAQLFAVPGSGTTGAEQTFMMVLPGSTLHTNLAPTVDQINADRVPGVVPPQYAVDPTLFQVAATSNNAGVIQITTVTPVTFLTGANVTVQGVEGTTEANGQWNATIVGIAPSANFTLNGSAFNILTNYTSGGTVALTTADRSDAVYDTQAGSARLGLDQLGYRVVLYPSNSTGTGPNLAAPITAIDPVISGTIPTSDQRMTIDYKAGIVRFSCEPDTGGQIKVSGGTNPTTGRLNLYATFWAFDQSLTLGASRNVYAMRSTIQQGFAPGRIQFNYTLNAWTIGSTSATNYFFIHALDPTEDTQQSTLFGTVVQSTTYNPIRYFAYRQGSGAHQTWTFLKQDKAFSGDDAYDYEMELGEKTSRTVGDITAPPQSPADYIPQTSYAGTNVGARNTDAALAGVLLDAIGNGYGTVHLRRGRYYVNAGMVVVPPGIIVEGEGQATVVESKLSDSASSIVTTPVFKFGANTPWRVYDPTYNTGTGAVDPTQFVLQTFTRIEGYDIVYNPVRRVWAIAVADAALDAIYFNEMHLDGTLVFPGLGINLKSSIAHLFTSTSFHSNSHTGGHYPRLAHQQFNDEYVVAWVEEIAPSATLGPGVVVSSFQVTFSPNQPSEQYSPTLNFTSLNNVAMTVPGGGYVYTTHPSISVDNGATGTSYTLVIQAWTYSVVIGSAPALLLFPLSAVTRQYVTMTA
jgi:hypothetical protein